MAEESELSRLLEHANENPIVIEKNGVRYTIRRVDDPVTPVDPEITRAAIRAAAGTISVEDAERMKATLYKAREETPTV